MHGPTTSFLQASMRTQAANWEGDAEPSVKGLSSTQPYQAAMGEGEPSQPLPPCAAAQPRLVYL